MAIDPTRYASALQYALAAHGAQRRKGSIVPYIPHPLAVSAILAQYGFDEDLVVAGLLHDVPEDAGLPPAEIAERFGPRVAELVSGVSELRNRRAALGGGGSAGLVAGWSFLRGRQDLTVSFVMMGVE